MFGLALVGFSAMTSAGGPAICSLAAEWEERPTAVRLVADCGGDPDLQAAADAALQRIDLNLPRVSDIRHEVADEAAFTPTERGWEPLPGQIIVRGDAVFPILAVKRGATHMVCALSIRPDRAGRVEQSRAECLSDSGRSVRTMERAALASLEAWRLLPTDQEYCLDEQIHVEARVILNGRAQPPRPMPDPTALPNLCAAE